MVLQLNSITLSNISCTCTHHRSTFTNFMRNICRAQIYHPTSITMVFVVRLWSYINNTIKSCLKCASISSKKKRLGINKAKTSEVEVSCITRDSFSLIKIRRCRCGINSYKRSDKDFFVFFMNVFSLILPHTRACVTTNTQREFCLSNFKQHLACQLWFNIRHLVSFA